MSAESNPAEWNPAELVLYAEEYLDMYILFAFKSADPHPDDPKTAVSYLESTLECIEDAHAALSACFANRNAKPS